MAEEDERGGGGRARRRRKSAAEEEQLGHLGVSPHGFRHGAASFAFVQGDDLELVRQLGRWASPKSVVRYQKFGRYLRAINRMTNEQLSRASVLLQSIFHDATRVFR